MRPHDKCQGLVIPFPPSPSLHTPSAHVERDALRDTYMDHTNYDKVAAADEEEAFSDNIESLISVGLHDDRDHHQYHGHADSLIHDEINPVLRTATSRSSIDLSLADIDIFRDDPAYEPPRWRRIIGQLWDTVSKPPNERRYIERLDKFILTYALLSYGLKSLDVSNISNAFVSGMQEDLHLYGQERNLFYSTYSAGYLLGSTPSQIIINRIRPSTWVPFCEFTWSILVGFLCAVRSAKQIYVLRFLIGLFESASYPAFAYILGSWYGPDELAKRMGVYDCAGYVANMLAGYLQAGIYATMNGVFGVAGWRWMFVIDGILGFPIAFWGYYCIPDFPNNTRARWLSTEDRELSLIRMKLLGRKEPRRLTVKRFIDMFFRSWRPWPFLISYTMLWTSGTSGYFNLWLKSLKIFSVEELNIIPTFGYALGLVSGFAFANLSDRTKYRWPWLFLATFFRFLGSLLLAIWDLPFGVIFFANMCSYLGEPVWSLLITWAAEEFQDDAELRGLLAAVGNTLGSFFMLWLPLLLFPTYQAPHYKLGYIFTTIFDVIDFAGLLAFLYFARKDRKRKDVIINKFGYAVNRDEYLQDIFELQNVPVDEYR
ncbi:major facilitator superfamily domain-containing protein [Limtongia smithiae]|uniref:major facilitator superfamily domain-containing protein n=1 Tax=Limtongia smithiae TaxID=1125753 RepID=UPI0034CEC6D0